LGQRRLAAAITSDALQQKDGKKNCRRRGRGLGVKVFSPGSGSRIQEISSGKIKFGRDGPRLENTRS